MHSAGSWLSINGDAIYRTRPWHYQNDTLSQNVWYDGEEYVSNFNYYKWFCCPCRYTYRPDTGAVYGILTQAYQMKVVLGNVKVGASGSKISLVGYTGQVTWISNAKDNIEITMPPLPLDTELKWAWVFKFENFLPNQSK